ncbi:MAG TPA: T9SS type A sorting domain-containing protein [Bacteroidales bacterium]|nr:T9SS type A sorting domain-containing protein [Bacteroidales bacterium]
MKKTKLLITALAFALMISANAQTTITMGAGYADDVFYSMKNGVTGIAARADWDLGFYTSPWSAGIITNGGSGIELRLYPYGDTSAWNSIDTTGMSGWPILYNGEDSWENGAFNRHSLEHPDYGWGVYNTQSHDVVGDSLYIIKLLDGTYKKLWIVRKVSTENKYVFRYGNLDNSYEEERTLLNNDYISMNFSYFDFASGSFFDREPDKTEWDILFTKYQAMQPQGVPYPVVGVLNNVGVKANRFHPYTVDFNEWYTLPFDSLKAVIGFDWKYFEMSTFQWSIEDSLLFFVNSLENDVYKLYFTYFAGTSSGDITFNDELMSLSGFEENALSSSSLTLSPNPANGHVNLKWNGNYNGEVNIRVFDLGGKELINNHVVSTGNAIQHRLDLGQLNRGMYIVSIIAGNEVINEKLVIE